MKSEQIDVTWKNPWDEKGGMKLETIYDALQRTDDDIRITCGDKYLKFDGEKFTVKYWDGTTVKHIVLVETESEAVAVMVLTGHAVAL